jgi:RHS repeat-associated protein
MGADRSGSVPRLLPAQQHRSTFRYDSMNREIEAVLVGRVGAAALNLTTRSIYDSRGNRIQVTDPAGGRTKSFFDGLNRLTRSEAGYLWNGSVESIPAGMVNAANPDGKITTQYSYDANSRLVAVEDDNHRVTSFQYDNLNRRIRTTYPDGSYRLSGYNRDSLATSWTQASGTGYFLSAVTQFDALHRAMRVDVSNALAPWVRGTQRQRFEYDGAGRMTLAEDDANTADGFADSTVTWTYSSMGGVLGEVQTWRDAGSGTVQSSTYAVASAYDGTGFRKSILYPDDRTVAYLPDELNRVESMIDSLTGATRYDYLGSRLLNRLHPNGTKLTLLSGPTDSIGSGYDAARRVIDFAHKLSSTGTDLARFVYGYDAAGNRVSERRVHQPSGPGWKGETFAYDAVYRLVGRKEGTLDAAGSLQGAATTSQDFTLDGLGNWRSHTKNSATYAQTVNALNQYVLFNGPSGQKTLTYDFLGNLSGESSAAGDQQYGYDFLNRLTSVLDAGGNLITYRYDAQGRRISKSLNGVVQARYVYDGSRMIQERDGTNPARLVASYVYGAGPDELITRRRWLLGSGGDLYYHTNALGSVCAVTSSAGEVVERYTYDAYGQVTFLSPSFAPLSSSAALNDILFTGRSLDPLTRIYDFRARAYHPYLGRFLQRDPLGESASLNLYNYVFNNPVNATDPSGMWSPPPGAFAAVMLEVHNFLFGGGTSLRARMQYRSGSFVHHGDASYRDFDAEQAANGAMADLDRENAEWAAHDAKQAAHNIRNQIRESLKLSGKNIEDPKGVDVLIPGLNQSILDEDGMGGDRNTTDIDRQAADLIAAGHVVIVVNADDMSTLMSTGFHDDAIQTLGNLVQGLESVAGGGVPINIEGFSRGAGAAIALTNELTAHRGFTGGGISSYLIDPFVGAQNRRIDDRSVNVQVYYSTLPGFVTVGAGVFGFQREVFQGDYEQGPLCGPHFPVFHGQMDSFDRGVLGLVTNQMMGGW